MRRIGIGIAAAAGLLAAGSVLPGHAETPADTLVIAKNIDDIITLDPAEVFELSGGEMINQVYDRIMAYEAEDTETLVGGVAESYSVSDDGRTITLTVRPGLTFHSGNPVRAEDVAFSLQRVIQLNLTPAFILTQLGWSQDNVAEMVKAVDEQTVELTIGEDFAPTFVLNCLSAGIGSVVDKELVLANEKDGDLGHDWLKTHSAGSGAFELKGWKASESVTMEANPDHRFGAPAMRRVIVRH
ncbi:MAG TPA: ABC transporter substrate-binding protein, partial [Geminicoccaceae bacterium]|nr:ABC transporter substrate-binding protein [Geminicoccaceae bacterium]